MTRKIILIKIDRRQEYALEVQRILTEYGCNIKVRLGLHGGSSEACVEDGLVILEVDGDKKSLQKMTAALNKESHVTAKLIEM